MTHFQDDLTAVAVAVAYFVMGAIMLSRVGQSRRAVGWLVTGLMAWAVTAIYLAPVVFHVPVVELRVALRFALFMFAVNYSIVHQAEFLTGARRLWQWTKSWKLHRS